MENKNNKRDNIKDQKKYNFGREMANISLDKIIKNGFINDGTGSLSIIPCQVVGNLIHNKEPFLQKHKKAVDFLVKNAKTDEDKGVADETKERLEQYIEEMRSREVCGLTNK